MDHYNNKPKYAKTDHVLNPSKFDQAYECIKNWPDYEPTPLISLDGLANDMGVGNILYKDESHRFGLKSFKALGGAYAVIHVVREHLKQLLSDTTITDEDIKSGKFRQHLKNFTVVTATDGNHGRSVAWGAHQCGTNCIIYMHKAVSQSRAIAVELLGATVVWVDGNYDDSLTQVKADAIKNEWHIISDTSYEGYMFVPKFVMAGYSVMTSEIENQIKEQELEIPTHIIIQGGVGGLAGTICSHAKILWGDDRPRFIVVEPEKADCLFQSAKHGAPKLVKVEQETIMAGLSCGEVSLIGWGILEDNTDDFVTVGDDNVPSAMRLLASGVGDDPKIEAGESAVAGLALLMELKDNPAMTSALGIDENSRILLFGTEGATDQEIYDKIIAEN